MTDNTETTNKTKKSSGCFSTVLICMAVFIGGFYFLKWAGSLNLFSQEITDNNEIVSEINQFTSAYTKKIKEVKRETFKISGEINKALSGNMSTSTCRELEKFKLKISDSEFRPQSIINSRLPESIKSRMREIENSYDSYYTFLFASAIHSVEVMKGASTDIKYKAEQEQEKAINYLMLALVQVGKLRSEYWLSTDSETALLPGNVGSQTTNNEKQQEKKLDVKSQQQKNKPKKKETESSSQPSTETSPNCPLKKAVSG